MSTSDWSVGFVAVTDSGCQSVSIAVLCRGVEAGVDTIPVSHGAPVLRPGPWPGAHRHWGWLGEGGGGGGGGHGEIVTETEEPRHSVCLTGSLWSPGPDKRNNDDRNEEFQREFYRGTYINQLLLNFKIEKI